MFIIVFEFCFCVLIFDFIVCFGQFFVNVDLDVCLVLVSYDVIVNGILELSYSYVFLGVIIVNGDGMGSSSIFEVGIIEVVIIGMNDCGLVICEFSIMVIDNIVFEV